MIRIYICDDEESVCRQLRTALERKIFMENYDMGVVCAVSTAQALLDAAEDNSRSVYFLDVDLKDREWDGFTLGRELRRRDPHGTLVYITSYGDLAWKTFQYHLEAFDYIVKEGELTASAAARCLEAIHARLLDERRDPVEVFSLRTGDETRHVPLADILFFETAPKAHHVYLHTADSRLDFVGSLNELEKELGERFIRLHRAYLAAWDKIEAVDGKGNKVRIGGRTCLLSRAGKAELHKKGLLENNCRANALFRQSLFCRSGTIRAVQENRPRPAPEYGILLFVDRPEEKKGNAMAKGRFVQACPGT